MESWTDGSIPETLNFIKCFSGHWKPLETTASETRGGKKGQRLPSRTFHVKDLQDPMMEVSHFTVEKPTTNTLIRGYYCGLKVFPRYKFSSKHSPIISCSGCCWKWSHLNFADEYFKIKVDKLERDYSTGPRFWCHCSIHFQDRKTINKSELLMITLWLSCSDKEKKNIVLKPAKLLNDPDVHQDLGPLQSRLMSKLMHCSCQMIKQCTITHVLHYYALLSTSVLLVLCCFEAAAARLICTRLREENRISH